MEKRLKIGEIVWAKIRGFPWWPGMIGKIEESQNSHQETKLLVNFIGDPSHADIPISKIEKFDKKFDEFSKTKKRRLIDSISLAKKIISGEITFINHLNYQNNEMKKKTMQKRKEDESEESDSEIENKKKRKFLNNKRNRIVSVSDQVVDVIRTKSTSISEKENETVKKNKNNITNEYKRKYNKKSDREESEEEELDDEEEDEEDPAELLRDKIVKLAFFRVELPSSTSNKSIINSLDEINEMIKTFEGNNFYDIIKGFNSLLVCLATHKNPNVSSKATILNNQVQQKLLEGLFNKYEELESIQEFSIINKTDTNELLNLISNLNSDLKLDSKLESAISKRKEIPNKKLNSKLKSRKDSINHREEIEHSHKEILALKLSIHKEEESNLLSEMSLNSDKTDCEDIKCVQKQRFVITPLDKKNIYKILCDYFTEYEIENEDNFHDGLTNGNYFNKLDENKISKPVKYPYMRRRVCIKLFKVLEKLCKNLSLDHDTIKNLSIYLEMKARDGDSEMTDKYRIFVSSIFNRIKEILIMSSLPLLDEIDL